MSTEGTYTVRIQVYIQLKWHSRQNIETLNLKIVKIGK